MMTPDLHAIVCAIAGALTTRTLEQLRKELENLYIRSTSQDASPEDQAAFNSTLIAQALEAARLDNARTIVSWALAIYHQLKHVEPTTDRLAQVQGYLATEKDKLAFYQQDSEASAATIQRTQENISRLESKLRDLSQPTPEMARCSPQEGSWEASTEYRELDSLL